MKRYDLASLVAVLLFCTFTASAQHPESRYVRYARTVENQALYDTADPHSFYNRALRIPEEAFHGMSAAEFAPIRAACGDSIPGFGWKFSPQDPWPIVNAYGEDSMLYLPDGLIVYVYAAPDSLFFVEGAFGDFVIEEQLVADTNSAQSWKPQRVFLRRCVPGKDEPLVIRSFDWSRLFSHMERYSALPATVSDSLGKALEQFISEGQRRFGGDGWAGNLSRYSVFEETPAGKRIGAIGESYDRDWQLLRASGEENGVFEKTYPWEKPFTNIYGEDSMRYNASLVLYPVMQSGVDTLLFVNYCFGQAYASHFLHHSDGRWQDFTYSLAVTKSAQPGGKEFVVYNVDGSDNNEYSNENREQLDYANRCNPLKIYLRAHAPQDFDAFSWQQLDGTNVFSGEPVVHP